MNRLKFAEFVQRVNPWSGRAFLFALLAFGAGTALRMIFAQLGATLYFATYFPVILVVSVFVGAPAGAATAIVSLLTVWWAFLPPHYTFTPLQPADYANFTLFAISAGLIIWLSHLYRSALKTLLSTQSQKDLLLDELNHRAGNLLTVVQSIIKGSLKDDKQASRTLSARIEALARADDLVSRTAQGSIALQSLLRREIAPFSDTNRVSLKGPDLHLSGTATRSIALVLHELTTNSAKYGALSVTTGEVDVSWSHAEDWCRLRWAERGGPPVERPTRTGFGSRMITACLQTLDGTINQDFGREGYSCDISFKLKPGAPGYSRGKLPVSWDA